QTAGVTQPGKFAWAIASDPGVPFISNYGNQGPGNPTSGVIGLSAIDPNLRNSYIYQYSFGVQRKIGRDFSVEADYQGSSGHKLMVSLDQNQPFVNVNDPTKGGKIAPNEQIFPYPSFARITMGKDVANSNYNGVVLTAKYQGRRGFYLETWYTYGKS